MKELRTQRPIGRKKFSTKKDAIFQNPEALINEIKFQLTANPTCSAVISKMLTSQIKDKSKKDDLEKLTLLHDLVISILSYFEENRLTLDQNLTTPLRQLRFYVVEQFNAILPKVKIIPSSTIESWIYAGTENNPKLFAIPDKEKATQASYSILQEIPDESFKKLFSSISPDDHELHENLRILLSNHQFSLLNLNSLTSIGDGEKGAATLASDPSSTSGAEEEPAKLPIGKMTFSTSKDSFFKKAAAISMELAEQMNDIERLEIHEDTDKQALFTPIIIIVPTMLHHLQCCLEAASKCEDRDKPKHLSNTIETIEIYLNSIPKNLRDNEVAKPLEELHTYTKQQYLSK